MTARKSARSNVSGALAKAGVVAFAATQRPEKAMAFYRDTLGLALEYSDQFALVFRSGGATVRVAVVPKVAPPAYTILGWTVPDIVATVKELSAAGVQFTRYPGMNQDDIGVWSAPSGARVAWFKDPDGNVLSLTEL
jgi:predicted enzyme related to lactoylglutathione lyase